MNLLNKLKVTKTTVSQDTDLTHDNVRMYDLIKYLEELRPDSNFVFDVNLQPLLDYLLEAGFTETEILEMESAWYGKFIDITYYKDLELYVMEIGVR